MSTWSIGPSHPTETEQRARVVLGDAETEWGVRTADEVCNELEASARLDETIPVTIISRDATRSALLTVLMCIRRDTDVTAVPDEALGEIRSAVRRGHKLDGLLRIVVLVHSAMVDKLFDRLSREVAPDRLISEARALSERMSRFVDLLVRDFPTLYEREQEEWNDRQAVLRRTVVDHVVEQGSFPDGAHSLGLVSSRHYVAALVEGGTPLPPTFATAVERSCGARSQLMVERATSTEIVWAFNSSPPNVAEMVRQSAAQTLPQGVVGLGVTGRGAHGLRDAVVAAREALRVGRLHESAGVWAYDDVSMTASLTSDPVATALFLRHTLDGLTGDDAKTVALRETLGSYLRHGRSRVAAGRELHVVPNTVAYRVHQAEVLLVNSSLDTPALRVALDLAHELPSLLRNP